LDLDTILGSTDLNAKILPCEIFVDEEGEWFHKGNRIIRDDILDLFYENLAITPEGRFIIDWRGKQCMLEAADTPFVISRVDRIESEDGGEAIFLTLRHIASRVQLVPETLQVGKENVMYCRIRSGQFPARFSRPAYYQLAEWIEENPKNGQFYIELNRNRYPLQTGE